MLCYFHSFSFLCFKTTTTVAAQVAKKTGVLKKDPGGLIKIAPLGVVKIKASLGVLKIKLSLGVLKINPSLLKALFKGHMLSKIRSLR